MPISSLDEISTRVSRSPRAIWSARQASILIGREMRRPWKIASSVPTRTKISPTTAVREAHVEVGRLLLCLSTATALVELAVAVGDDDEAERPRRVARVEDRRRRRRDARGEDRQREERLLAPPSCASVVTSGSASALSLRSRHIAQALSQLVLGDLGVAFLGVLRLVGVGDEPEVLVERRRRRRPPDPPWRARGRSCRRSASLSVSRTVAARRRQRRDGGAADLVELFCDERAPSRATWSSKTRPIDRCSATPKPAMMRMISVEGRDDHLDADRGAAALAGRRHGLAKFYFSPAHGSMSWWWRSRPFLARIGRMPSPGLRRDRSHVVSRCLWAHLGGARQLPRAVQADRDAIIDSWFVFDHERNIVDFNRAFFGMLPRNVARGLKGKKCYDVLELNICQEPLHRAAVLERQEAGAPRRDRRAPSRAATAARCASSCRRSRSSTRPAIRSARSRSSATSPTRRSCR